MFIKKITALQVTSFLAIIIGGLLVFYGHESVLERGLIRIIDVYLNGGYFCDSEGWRLGRTGMEELTYTMIFLSAFVFILGFSWLFMGIFGVFPRPRKWMCWTGIAICALSIFFCINWVLDWFAYSGALKILLYLLVYNLLPLLYLFFSIKHVRNKG